MLFLELWQMTENSLWSIQLKELDNNSLRIWFQSFSKIPALSCSWKVGQNDIFSNKMLYVDVNNSYILTELLSTYVIHLESWTLETSRSL